MFFKTVWEVANALLFLRGRLFFHVAEDTLFERKGKPPIFVKAGDRAPANGGAPSVLIAYGPTDAEILSECGLDGHFIPLIFQRSVLVKALRDATWRELVADVLAEHDGPIEVAVIYAAVASHPKARGKPHVREKVRQTLQRGAGVRIARNLWEARP